MINGELLAHKDDHMLAREYSNLCGQLDGLLYLQRVIEDFKEEEKERNDQRNDYTNL